MAACSLATCGLRTRPRTVVDPPRVELPSARAYRLAAPRGDNLLQYVSAYRPIGRYRHSKRNKSMTCLKLVADTTLRQLTLAVNTNFFCTNNVPFARTHRFNGPLSGTIRVSRYQKGKTNLDFTEARDSEWQWHHLGNMQVCTSLHTNTPPLSFFRPDALPATPPTVSKH